MTSKKIIALLKPFIFSLLALISFSLHADGALDTTFNGTGTVQTPIPGFTTPAINGVYIQADGNIVGVGNDTPLGVNSGTSFIAARYLTGGTLDPVFGTAGISIISLALLNATGVEATGVAVQADGKIVVVGTIIISQVTERIFVARLTSTGTLDATFNAAGALPGVFVFPGFLIANGNDKGNAVVIDVDGKIVVAGDANLGQRMAIGRLNANGTPDVTFNGTGQQTVLIGSQSSAFAVALQADGKTIIAAGSAVPSTGPATGVTNFAFARLLSTGVVDITRIALFSTDATELINITSEVHSILIQPNGEIVLIGFTDWFNGGSYFALARYDILGNIDTTFIGTPQPVLNPHQNLGTFIAPSDTSSIEASVALAGGLQSDGKIVAAGFGPETLNVPGTRFMLARFNGATGTLDATFNGGGAPVGFVFTQIGADIIDEIHAMALQGNGDIVAAGTSRITLNPLLFDFALARYVVSTPLQLTTIITPATGAAFSAGPISFTGLAQNPSIVDFFLDGTQIQADSTVTIGTGNGWSIPNVAIGGGVHTVRVVGRYRDDGHVNFADEITFEICNVVAAGTGVNDCVNGTISGSLVPLVTGGTGPYSFSVAGAPIGGSVNVSSTGLFTFTAATGFSGPGGFSFQVTDPFGCTAQAAVDVTVASPIAGSTGINACFNSSVSGSLAPLVSSGFPPYVFGLTGSPVGGTASVSSTGIYNFVPIAGFSGPGGFVYQVTDTANCLGTGAVNVTVDSLGAGNTGITVCASGISGSLQNLVFGGTGALAFTGPLSVSCTGSLVTISSTGRYNYVSPSGFTGPCNFVYQVTDGVNCSASGTVTITANTNPIANNATLNTCRDRAISDTLARFISGSPTPPLTFAIVSDPVHGTITAFNATTGAFTYTPNPIFVGVDSFQYQVTDATGCVSNVGTITINIPCCPPTAPFPALVEQLYFNLPPLI